MVAQLGIQTTRDHLCCIAARTPDNRDHVCHSQPLSREHTSDILMVVTTLNRPLAIRPTSSSISTSVARGSLRTT